MQKKYVISVAALTAVALCVLSTNLVLRTFSHLDVQGDACEVQAVNIGDELERLRELTPTTFSETELEMHPVRNRFLMWTRNGAHVMWGFYSNGRFVGTDNIGKRCWGIYGKDVFAGFYDGEFFWGRYNAGAWKAQHLFGLKYSCGGYMLFPRTTSTVNST